MLRWYEGLRDPTDDNSTAQLAKGTDSTEIPGQDFSTLPADGDAAGERTYRRGRVREQGCGVAPLAPYKGPALGDTDDPTSRTWCSPWLSAHGAHPDFACTLRL